MHTKLTLPQYVKCPFIGPLLHNTIVTQYMYAYGAECRPVAACIHVYGPDACARPLLDADPLLT